MKTPAKKTAKKKFYTKDLKNYTFDEAQEKWFDLKGNEVTHAPTLNILRGRVSGFKKGQSGNPAGRPKGAKNRSTLLKELLELTVRSKTGMMKHPLDPSKKSIDYQTAVMVALIKKAMSGDVKAIQEIQDTMYGKIKDETDVLLHQNEPLQVTVNDKNAFDRFVMNYVSSKKGKKDNDDDLF